MPASPQPGDTENPLSPWMDQEDWLEGQQSWAQQGEAIWAANEWHDDANPNEALGKPSTTAPQKQILHDYAERFSKPLNRFLRFTGNKEELEDALGDTSDLKEATTHLDRMFENQRPVTQRFTTFRGVSRDFIESMKKGGVLTDRGFVSTAISEEQARDYPFNLGDRRTGFILEIHVPPGAKAVSMDRALGKDTGEVLLPRDSKFQVISRDGNRFTVQLITGQPLIEPAEFDSNGGVFDSVGQRIGAFLDNGVNIIAHHIGEEGRTNLHNFQTRNAAIKAIQHYHLVNQLLDDTINLPAYPSQNLGGVQDAIYGALYEMQSSHPNDESISGFLDAAAQLADEGENSEFASRITTLHTSIAAGGPEPVAKKLSKVDSITAAHRDAATAARKEFNAAIQPFVVALNEANDRFQPEYERIVGPAKAKMDALQLRNNRLQAFEMKDANRRVADAQRHLNNGLARDPSTGALLATELENAKTEALRLAVEMHDLRPKIQAAGEALRDAENKGQEARDAAIGEVRQAMFDARTVAENNLDQALLAARETAFRARGGTGKFSLEAERRQRRAELHEIIHSREKTSTAITRGSVGDTRIVTYEHDKKAVLKTQEPGLNDREEAGLHAAHALGIADAPVFIRVSPDTIALEFVDGPVGAEVGMGGLMDSPAGKRIGLLDRIIINEDRNDGNFMVSSITENALPIDHGFAFDGGLGTPPGSAQTTDSPFAQNGEPAFDQQQYNEWRTELQKLETFFNQFKASATEPGRLVSSGAQWFQRMMQEFEHWAHADETNQSRAAEAQQDVFEQLEHQVHDTSAQFERWVQEARRSASGSRFLG